jgi:hypothetical protein
MPCEAAKLANFDRFVFLQQEWRERTQAIAEKLDA